MELIGEIRAGEPLLVVALHSEARYLSNGWPVLITGVGKVAAATAVRGALNSQLPNVVVNVGTAGALRDGLAGAYWVSRVIQHDFDSPTMRSLTGIHFGGPIELGWWPVNEPAVRCATGDLFVADGMVRRRLALEAELCDMEGYAVAFAAADAGVPVAMLKYVSDPADENARRSWAESVDHTARGLADAVHAYAEELVRYGVPETSLI